MYVSMYVYVITGGAQLNYLPTLLRRKVRGYGKKLVE